MKFVTLNEMTRILTIGTILIETKYTNYFLIIIMFAALLVVKYLHFSYIVLLAGNLTSSQELIPQRLSIPFLLSHGYLHKLLQLFPVHFWCLCRIGNKLI